MDEPKEGATTLKKKAQEKLAAKANPVVEEAPVAEASVADAPVEVVAEEAPVVDAPVAEAVVEETPAPEVVAEVTADATPETAAE